MPRLNGLVTVSKGNGQNGTGEPREDVGVCDGVSQILGAKVCTQARLTLKPNSLPLPGSGTLGFGRECWIQAHCLAPSFSRHSPREDSLGGLQGMCWPLEWLLLTSGVGQFWEGAPSRKPLP